MSRKKFQRTKPTKSYRKIFHVFTEGNKTEPIYFEIFKSYLKIQIKTHLSNNKNTAKQILQKVKKFISKEKPLKIDEIWVMLDVDKNCKQDLHDIKEWCNKRQKRGLALSNPKFEYWLLLHFDKGDDIRSPEAIDKRLEKYLPNFSKNNLNLKKLEYAIPTAIRYSKEKYSQCKEWYTDYHSTVFQLVEQIVKSERPSL